MTMFLGKLVDINNWVTKELLLVHLAKSQYTRDNEGPYICYLLFVKILCSPLKFPSVNQTHSKHPTSTELLTNGTISVKFNILLPSVLSLRLKGTLEIHIKTCLGQYLI